jgi:hypothetical protein
MEPSSLTTEQTFPCLYPCKKADAPHNTPGHASCTTLSSSGISLHRHAFVPIPAIWLLDYPLVAGCQSGSCASKCSYLISLTAYMAFIFHFTATLVTTSASLLLRHIIAWKGLLTLALKPPSRFSTQLFAYSFLARKSAASAISSGLPKRLSGIFARALLLALASIAAPGGLYIRIILLLGCCGGTDMEIRRYTLCMGMGYKCAMEIGVV